jgi:hypothetical protein
MIIFKVEGLADVENALLGLAEGFRTDLVMRNTVIKALKRAAEPMASAVAAAPIPFDEKNTGHTHLRDTLRLDVRTPSARDRESSMVAQTDIAIAVISVKKSGVSLSQEFGNARTPGRPYLRQAMNQQNAEQAVRIFKSELETLIPAYATKLAKRG